MMVETRPDTPPRVDPGPAHGTEQLRVVGTSPAHHDFVDKVKGSLLYAADWKLPGMLYGKLVRSDIPCGHIVDIDTTAAQELPGVVAVLTAKDVPSNQVVVRASGGLAEVTVAQPVLAQDQVRYVGEPVAVIAATEPEIADQAADLVVVTYEELPGVFDAETALAADAPLVHDVGNVLVNWHIERGDVDQAMADADVVVDGEYRSQHVEHAYLETEAGVAWMENDVVTLRVSTQVVEHATEIAQILALPENKVRVIGSYMGGGFGGKEDMTVEPYLALLAWRTRKPVRIVWSRQESMTASVKRHPFVMRYRTGAKADGTIVGQHVEVIGDAGAYPGLSPRVLFAGAALAAGPYRTPTARISSRAVFTNNVPTGAFRGFGAMQVIFGYESQMDRLARRLNLTREQVRLRNYMEKGDLLPTGGPLTTAVAVKDTQERALRGLGKADPPSGAAKRVGQGFASSMQPYGRTIWFRDHASAWLTLQADGSLLIRSGVTDLGAGQAASLCQIASEVLGVPLEDISVYIGDTALNPPAGGTFATRQLFMSGNAILTTAHDLRDRLAPVAAELLDTSVDQLRWEDGLVKRAPGSATDMQGVSLAELARACQERAVDTSNLCTWRAPVGTFDPATGQGDIFPDYTFGTHAAEVEVDVETGEVTVRKYVASHDVGRQINPVRTEGQIQGGAMQGLGYALMENFEITEGQPQSALFANYLIPSSMDMPDIQTEVVESGEGRGPLNARGIGEPPIGPPAAAVASAIEDAVGVRPTRLPMTPERILQLLQDTSSTTENGDAEP
jgi:nicotinate dehydrogenase large molybdopterin subunit